jgi:hypothetical protein
MCNTDTIKTSALAQAGLAESLELYGGAWTVKTGFDMGDYLVTAPGVAEVVTVWQDADGARRWHCTCEFDLFDAGTSDTGACVHIGLCAIFLNLNLTALAGDLGRAVLRMRRLAANGADPALQAAAQARAGELSFWYHQRKAATVRRMPYRAAAPAQPTEGASAPSLAGRVNLGAAFDAMVAELWGPAPALVQVAA